MTNRSGNGQMAGTMGQGMELQGMGELPQALEQPSDSDLNVVM